MLIPFNFFVMVTPFNVIPLKDQTGQVLKTILQA